MNSIFTHPSGGQLFQGDMNDVRRLLSTPHDEVRVIGLFAREFQPDDPSGHYELIKLGYNDRYRMGPVELSEIANLADQASDTIANRLRNGLSCLSSCAAGINRSGLVSGLTLLKMTDLDPHAVIEQVRERRGVHWGMTALANPSFVKIIHQMKDVGGLKEAYTIWQKSGVTP